MTSQDYEEYKRLLERNELWKENRQITITEEEFSQVVCELITGSEPAVEHPLLGLALLTFEIQIHKKIFNLESEEK